MKYLICSFLLLFCTSMVAKEVFNDKNLIKSKYDSIVESKKGFYSIDNLVSLTKTRNSFYLQHFGYYINSNNIMYEKTLDKKYLDFNYKLIASTIYDLNEYKLNAPKNNVNVKHNGEEFILFEGYFFRYVSQYLYILHKDNLLDNYKDSRMFSKLLERRIDLWKARSIRRYNNDYLFKKNTMHIWVLWIHSYVYLDAISGKQKYEADINEFFETFNQALFENNKKNVVWYSYITKKESIVIKNVIPDISHANHIISFFYDIFKYDLVKTEINQNLFTEVFTTFSNSESFYIDGSIGKEKEEWRLSDGWLKLLDLANASERNNLKAIQEKMIKKHWIDIENSLLYIQFLAVLY